MWYENRLKELCLNLLAWILFVIGPGVCPVLCSNHGKYGGGLCHCEEGWKGPECDIPEHDCQVPDCSGHGQCLAGVCVCQPGWKGTFCEQGEWHYLFISWELCLCMCMDLFVVYLMMLSVAKTVFHKIVGWWVENELETVVPVCQTT